MNDRIQRPGKSVLDTMKDSAREVIKDQADEKYRIGFSRSAQIALRHLEDKLDTLKETMKDRGLSKAEQLLYAHLDELRIDIETSYDRYWQGNGAAWRLPKPVAKPLVKNSGESIHEE